MTNSTPELYSDLVKGLLDAEATRRTALEAKGSTIITTAGTLATLLFGLVAVVTGQKDFALPGAAHGWLVAAIILFVAACFFAILTSVPLPYGETEIDAQQLGSWWNQNSAVALLAITSARLQGVQAARRMNTLKAIIVMVATACLIAALVMLAIAVIEIISAT